MVWMRTTWTERELWRYSVRYMRLHDPKSYRSLNHLHLYRYGGCLEQQIDSTSTDYGVMGRHRENFSAHVQRNWGVSFFLFSLEIGL